MNPRKAAEMLQLFAEDGRHPDKILVSGALLEGL
jgi:hypothetical protein